MLGFVRVCAEMSGYKIIAENVAQSGNPTLVLFDIVGRHEKPLICLYVKAHTQPTKGQREVISQLASGGVVVATIDATWPAEQVLHWLQTGQLIGDNNES